MATAVSQISSSLRKLGSIPQNQCLRRLYASAAQFTSIVSSNAEALALIRSQPSVYVIAQLHLRMYLLTPNDILTVPRIHDLRVGDRIRLSRILEVGSRDYTLKAPSALKGQIERPALPEDDIHVEATVIEHTKSKMQFIEKFKRRKRYHRRIGYKGHFTRIRINDIRLGGESMSGDQKEFNAPSLSGNQSGTATTNV